jgi:hypothetical protein
MLQLHNRIEFEIEDSVKSDQPASRLAWEMGIASTLAPACPRKTCAAWLLATRSKGYSRTRTNTETE